MPEISIILLTSVSYPNKWNKKLYSLFIPLDIKPHLLQIVHCPYPFTEIRKYLPPSLKILFHCKTQNPWTWVPGRIIIPTWLNPKLHYKQNRVQFSLTQWKAGTHIWGKKRGTWWTETNLRANTGKRYFLKILFYNMIESTKIFTSNYICNWLAIITIYYSKIFRHLASNQIICLPNKNWVTINMPRTLHVSYQHLTG